MLRSANTLTINDHQRLQLVPSPSQVPSPSSPLELESWYMPDFEWLKEPITPTTTTSPMELSPYSTERFYLEDYFPKLQSHNPTTQINMAAPIRRQTHNNNNNVNLNGNNCNNGSLNYSMPPTPPYAMMIPQLNQCHVNGAVTTNKGHNNNNMNYADVSPAPSIMLIPEIKREVGVDTYRENNNCAFKMVDIKTEPGTYNPSACQLSIEKMEQLQSMAMEQASKDINSACGNLGIGPDPRSWSVEEVRAWIGWVLRQYDLQPVPQLDRVRLDGPALCGLSEEQLRRIAPHCGDILYAQLDIWKTAGDIQHQQSPLHNMSFKGDDTFLDLSTILGQWNADPAPRQNCVSPVSPSTTTVLQGQLHAQAQQIYQNNACSPSPHDGASVVPEIKINGTASDFNSEGIPSEDEASDDNSVEFDVRVANAGVGTVTSTGRPGSHSHIHLWQFLKELLSQPHLYGSSIRWLDRGKGVFKIEDSVRVARLWGKRKNRPAMNYDKLSRSIRQYYKKGIMKKTERSQRLVYQFCHPYCL